VLRLKYKEAVRLEVKRGKTPIGRKPDKADLFRLYVKESRSIRDTAHLLGCTKDMVYRALKEYGIELRKGVARSKLRTISLRDLEAAIKEKGLRGASRYLGVDHSTLRHHLKVRRGQ